MFGYGTLIMVKSKHGRQGQVLEKKFEISNKKNNMGLDLSFIQLDESILDGINVISDTLSYNDRDCYVVDFYKMRKSRKVGPISKFWIDADNYNIHKIQKFDKRGRMLSEAIFEEYSDINFPKKLIISDTKKKTKTSIDIDYDDKTDFNLDNFNPRDIEWLKELKEQMMNLKLIGQL